MAELIADLMAIRFLEMGGQGQVAGAADWVLHPFRTDRPEFVSEAKVDVVEEPGTARTIVLVGVKCLHDVLLASLTVLGDRGQVPQVDQEVLRPVFPVLPWHRPVHVPVNPVADVFGKPLVKLVTVLWHNEPVVPDMVPVNKRERVRFPVFNRNSYEIDGLILDCDGIALHGYFLSKGFELHASKPKRSRGVGCTGSAGVGTADQERSRARRGSRDRVLRSHSAQQSGNERLHAEAGQLW
ncbi:MAG: hypothetical protein WB952_17315 [Terriglobales bacterium]